MRVQAFILLLIILVPHSGFAQEFKFADEHQFKLTEKQGRVEISLNQVQLRKGGRYAVNYRFTNTGGSYPIYNWQFLPELGLPGQLAIYDADRDYIGDLTATVFGSRARAQLRDWTYLYGGSYVGASLGFRAGSVPRTKYMAEGSLPAGIYYIQLIMYRAFVSERPYLAEEVLEDMRQKFDRAELCRSNVIRVEVVDK